MPHVLAPSAIADETDELGIGVGDAPPGTYVLLFELPVSTEISVGSLGSMEFPAGAYAYIGSAFGSNGLGRVARHCRVATGEHDVRHWHVDYFGGYSETELVSVVAAPRADAECAVATALGPESSPVSGFGSSDCHCLAHLAFRNDRETLCSAVLDCFEGKELGENPQ
ncbi:GIY-YIG nuclease family protein [Halogeometricum borinquense]|uniref:GIY-YIG nuclease family protein n=1 Tax=Halogeometricum borinquense TaxID=60847 RepID=A0A6C0UP02_9EURY|nr:GIY-YIG nuclease family protein [Halogeometricum borinquense]QIB74668.1 GIY-YIG nuclease family protein [Halogeometricum borinquense]QIQ76379.1 GIY-YIG nuclease family protein [Halogeometricum borinquense]